MFRYFYHIYDEYDKEVVSIAVLTDENRRFKPNKFGYELYGTKLMYKYNTSKLIRYKERELIGSDNPFALVVLASNYSLKAKRDEEKKLEFKRKLVELMFKKGYTEEEIRGLFRFIDEVIYFKRKKMEDEFLNEVEKIKEVKEVPHLIPAEKVLLKREREKGRLESTQEDVIDAVEVRFNVVPEDIAKSIKEIKDMDVLKDLLKRAIKSETLDEFRTELKVAKGK